VFLKLSNLLKSNIQGIGNAAHVVQSGIQTSADISLLHIDIETVMNKTSVTFSYVHCMD
jgi:hypothetical protein